MNRLATALAGPLHIFVRVAELEHISAAADDLALPQSTVTRTIQRLENAAGTPLFDRVGRRLQLTTAGRALADDLTATSKNIDTATARHLRDTTTDGGLVRLAFLHSLGSPQVPLLVTAFRENHPSARFDLRQNSHTACVNLLDGGEVDLALLAPPPPATTLESTVLYRQPLKLAVAATHPLARRDTVHLGELLDDDFISFTPGIGLREYTLKLAAASGFTPRIVCQTQDADTARGLVAAGLGVAVVPARVATSRGENTNSHRDIGTLPEVVELALDDPAAVREMSLVWRKDAQLAPMAAAFHTFVLRHGAGLMGF